MKKRYALLDNIRGLNLISMILYHMVWDMVYIFGVGLDWFESGYAYVWQQTICWLFIFLSGFCWNLGRHHLKRGVTILAAGTIVTAITVWFMPEQRIVFGVLTLLGVSVLLLIPFDVFFRKIPPLAGTAASLLLFGLLRNVNQGYLGFEQWNFVKIPERLYGNLFSSFLGFTQREFFSTDYFSVFPWFFLFCAGYFTYRMLGMKEKATWNNSRRIPLISGMGRHSLLIYLLHQPAIYLLLTIIFTVKNT